MIWRAFRLSIDQFDDPRFRRVILLGLIFAILVLAALTALLVLLIQWAIGDTVNLPLIGEVSSLGSFLSFGAIFAMSILSIFVMLPLSTAISSFFLDDVADAVEARHYAFLPPVAKPKLFDLFRDMINFWGVLIVANLFAFILYIIFTPFAPLIFWGVNGYVLGREYFAMAAMRRLDVLQMRRLRKENAATLWGSGALLAILMTIPIVNLIVPVLGIAVFTHLTVLAMDQSPSKSSYSHRQP